MQCFRVICNGISHESLVFSWYTHKLCVCVYQGNTSDKWDMPWYTGARWEGWMQYHQQIQWFSCILIGLFSIAWGPTETWIKRSRQDKTRQL